MLQCRSLLRRSVCFTDHDGVEVAFSAGLVYSEKASHLVIKRKLVVKEEISIREHVRSPMLIGSSPKAGRVLPMLNVSRMCYRRMCIDGPPVAQSPIVQLGVYESDETIVVKRKPITGVSAGRICSANASASSHEALNSKGTEIIGKLLNRRGRF